MKDVEVKSLLERLNKINKDVERVNQVAVQNKGFKKAQIEQIQSLAKELQLQGVDLTITVDEKGRISEKSRKDFVKVFTEEYKAKATQAATMEVLLEAVEKKDYAKIKELTGEDVQEESYELEVKTVKELMARENEDIAVLKQKLAEGGVEAAGVDVNVVEEVKEEKVVTEEKEGVQEEKEVVQKEVVQEEIVEDNSVLEDSDEFSFDGNFGLDFGVDEPVVEVPKVVEEVKPTAKAKVSRRSVVTQPDIEPSQDLIDLGLEDDETGTDIVLGGVEEVKNTKVEEKEDNGLGFDWGIDEVEESEALDGIGQIDSFFSGMNKVNL
jgi:hypothetical protein